ncbi:hypothetical protein ACKGJO_06740 [Gracilimonas sp. Q87]|uniref:hypothetical protein n=1 Tax=Gracilimonas sp. Q87 TaxID=3384766 RepID=UPI0039840550
MEALIVPVLHEFSMNSHYAIYFRNNYDSTPRKLGEVEVDDWKGEEDRETEVQYFLLDKLTNDQMMKIQIHYLTL